MQAVALVLGLMVVLALSLAAYYAYKTRSKIWRHGKPNITWDPPLVTLQAQDVQDWVSEIRPLFYWSDCTIWMNDSRYIQGYLCYILLYRVSAEREREKTLGYVPQQSHSSNNTR